MTAEDPPPGEGRPAASDSSVEERSSPPVETDSLAASERTDTDEESWTRGVGPLEDLQTSVRRIEGRIRWKWGISAVLSAAVVGAIVGAISVFGLEWGPIPGIAVGALLAILGVGHVLLRYRSWRYEVREDALYLERGVLTHVKTVVPFVRVQHIDTSRGPVDRVIDLSSLVVYTAGSRGADVTIPGLTPEDAEDLQDRLKLLAKESTGDDAV